MDATPPFARVMTLVQIVGAVLAIPVGLASGYSVYRANFSPDITCQNMRANIIGTLGKNVDATTLRMLVRHDVVVFERSCGTVDPDATAAFKRLLDADKSASAATSAATKPEPKRHAEAPAKPAHPAAVQPTQAATKKQEHPAAAVAASTPARGAGATDREATAADATWVASVRRALQTHPSEPARAGKDAQAAAPAASPLQAAPAQPAPPLHAAPSPQISAPPLPPATAITGSVEPKRDATTAETAGGADHPVPPAPVPGAAPVANLAAAAEGLEQRGDRGQAGWVSRVPVLGSVLGAFDGRVH